MTRSLTWTPARSSGSWTDGTGRDGEGVSEWLFARPLQWRLGVRDVSTDPSAAFRQALRMSLPRTVVSVNAFHLGQAGQ
ncbi:transposase [Arthrobacter sp. KN11-1C]|uniref:transposase n=1 Tax=Arthrobacter sp. KN11-1C TaxID=3445774 RepID=UPI003FA13293